MLQFFLCESNIFERLRLNLELCIIELTSFSLNKKQFSHISYKLNTYFACPLYYLVDENKNILPYPWHSQWAFCECFVRLTNFLERFKNNLESSFFFCYVPESRNVPWTFWDIPEHFRTFVWFSKLSRKAHFECSGYYVPLLMY
jgi:hypothetical protein